MRSTAANLTLLGLTIALTLSALELATRSYFHDITTTGDNGSYFAARWRAGVRLNRFGFPDDDFSPEPAPGVFRIAVVGDPFTYGQGIEEDTRLTEHLARQLNETRAGAFEVLNFGRAGADYEGHFEILTVVLKEAQPDFVLLQWVQNDLRDPDVRGPGPWHLAGPLHRYVYPRSALYYLAETAFVEAQYALALLPPADDYYLEHFRGADGPVATRARQRLEAVLDLAGAHDVPVAMILWPSVKNEGTDFGAQDFLFAHVLAVCGNRHMACLDLRPGLIVPAHEASLRVNRFDAHPSAYANRLAAVAVYGAFEDLWLEAAARKTASGRLTRAGYRQHHGCAKGMGVFGRRRKPAVQPTGRDKRRGLASRTVPLRSRAAFPTGHATVGAGGFSGCMRERGL